MAFVCASLAASTALAQVDTSFQARALEARSVINEAGHRCDLVLNFRKVERTGHLLYIADCSDGSSHVVEVELTVEGRLKYYQDCGWRSWLPWAVHCD